jgi:hypothetical protein
MTYDPRNPDPREADEADGLGTGIIATPALAVLALAGIVFAVVSMDRPPPLTDRSAIERSAPPATTGQGGVDPNRAWTGPAQ